MTVKGSSQYEARILRCLLQESNSQRVGKGMCGMCGEDESSPLSLQIFPKVNPNNNNGRESESEAGKNDWKPVVSD